MPFPFIPVIGGLAAAKWGPAIWEKVKGVFGKRDALTHLDPGLTPLERKDVQNLLSTITDPVLLKSAISYYQARGFPISAQALAMKLLALKG